MGMRIRYEDTDTMEVIIRNIGADAQKAGISVQKTGAKVIRKAIVKNLESIKTTDEQERQRLKHMCEDVQIRTYRDKYGDTVVKVQGGKETGTLWHIVNDGTYRTKARHFMNFALSEVEQEIENVIDQELKKVFG